MEITGHELGTAGRVVHNHPAVRLCPLRRRFCSLGLSAFHLFVSLRKHLAASDLTVDADVKQAVTSWLEALDADFFYAAMQDLVSRLNVAGNCVEG